ncbi:MAG: valyl-tRNA synthetase [Lysinibacillus sp.]
MQIKPQWQSKQLDDSLRLIGIYHITAHVRFDFKEPLERNDAANSIVIDALDIQGDTGYFEYAVPLHVDLPKDAAVDDLFVKGVQTSLNNNECRLQWEICSMYQQPEVVHAKKEPAVTHVEDEQRVAVAAPVEEKRAIAIEFESSSHRMINMQSSNFNHVQEVAIEIDDDIPMIWDLKENYTLLQVRASNNVV